MLPRSLRFKIVLSSTALLTLTMLIFSLVLYDRLFYDLYSQLDNLLQSRAAGVADAINTYWEVEKLDASREGADPRAFKKAGNINFVKIAQRWVDEESNRPELLNIVVQIFSAQGRLIAASKNVNRIIVFPERIFESALQGHTHFNTVAVPFNKERPTIMRVFTKPVIEDGAITYIVQVASPLTSLENARNNLKRLLTILLPLLVVFSILIGLVVAKMTLKPVDRMIQAVQQITARSLRQRIPVPDTRDAIQRLAATFNDMLERLERSFESQRRFLQEASHELKTPLTILEGEMSVALKRERTPEEYESVLRSSLEEIDRLSRIVHNLLTLARFEDREIVPQLEELDLSDAVCSIADDMQVLAGQKRIALDCSAPAGIRILADKHYLRQVFVNLIGNAVKYTPEGGTVTVEAAERDGLAAVTVRDTGIGMHADELAHIFNRFYRAEKSRSSSGFGLGLSIAKSIVDAHGGSITVESTPGQGSCFTVSLPVH